jgi:hypothetical protein
MLVSAPLSPKGRRRVDKKRSFGQELRGLIRRRRARRESPSVSQGNGRQLAYPGEPHDRDFGLEECR